MLAHPLKDARVIIRYAKEMAHLFQWHGCAGKVVISAKGPGPLNHLIQLDQGPLVIVPCGNLVKEQDFQNG